MQPSPIPLDPPAPQSSEIQPAEPQPADDVGAEETTAHAPVAGVEGTGGKLPEPPAPGEITPEQGAPSEFPADPTVADVDLEGRWPALGERMEGITLDPSESGELNTQAIEGVEAEADDTASLTALEQRAIAEAIRPPAPSEEVAIPTDLSPPTEALADLSAAEVDDPPADAAPAPLHGEDEDEEATSVYSADDSIAQVERALNARIDGAPGESTLAFEPPSDSIVEEAEASMILHEELVLPEASMDASQDVSMDATSALMGVEDEILTGASALTPPPGLERPTPAIPSRQRRGARINAAPEAASPQGPGGLTGDFDAPTEALKPERAALDEVDGTAPLDLDRVAEAKPSAGAVTPEVAIPATHMLSFDEGADRTRPLRAEDLDDDLDDEGVISSALHLPEALGDPFDSQEIATSQKQQHTVHLERRRGRPSLSRASAPRAAEPPSAQAGGAPADEDERPTNARGEITSALADRAGAAPRRRPQSPPAALAADPEAETQHKESRDSQSRDPQPRDLPPRSPQRPASKPQAPARRPGPVDLLDIPLDPDDFHPPPPVRAATPPPMPQSRVTPAPAPQRQPTPAPRPERSKGAPLPSAPAARPQPAPTPVPSPAVEPGEIPNYGQESSSPFGSYYDNRSQVNGQVSAGHDAVDQLVPQAPPPARRPQSLPGTVAAPTGDPHRVTVLKALGLGGAVMLVVLGLLSTWRYLAVVGDLDAQLAETAAQLEDGNYISRVDGTVQLPEVVEAGDPLARAGDAVVRLFGGDGLGARRAKATALLARLHAERVVMYGDLPDLERATEALARARSVAPSDPDTGLAEALLTLHRHAYDEARGQLQTLDDANPGRPEIEYALALVALAAGQQEVALDRLRSTIKLDPGHVNAHMLMADLKRGDAQAALTGYDQILERHNAQHVDTRIARGRLIIEARPDQSMEAVEQLKTMLQMERPQLSQAQAARIQEAVGLFYMKHNDVEAARRAFKGAVEAAPDDPRFATGLARLDLAEFKLSEAEDMISRAIELAPDSAIHRLIMAQIRLLQGDPQGALTQLDAVTRPDAEGWMRRGQAYLDLEQWPEAERALEQAARLDPGLLDAEIRLQLAAYLNGRALGLSRLEEIEAGKIRQGVRLQDATLPHRAHGEALRRGKDKRALRAAMTHFKQAILTDPNDYRAHYAICQIYMARANADGALTHCKTTIRINPYFAPAVLDQSAIAEAQRDAGGVIASLAPFIEQRPGHPQAGPAIRRLARAYIYRATTLQGTGDAEHFMAKAEALANDPKITVDESSKRYVRGLIQMARGDLKDAVMELSAASDQRPNDGHVHMSLGDALMRQQAPKKAAGFYRRAVKASGLPDAALGVARAALSLGDWQMAQNAAEEAERLALKSLSHPRSRAEALSIQAQVAFEQDGRRGQRQAQRLAERALKISADLPSALITLGRLAEEDGALDDAAARFQRATQVDLRNPEAQYRLGRLLVGQSDTRAQGMEMLAKVIALDPDGRWGQLARRARQR